MFDIEKYIEEQAQEIDVEAIVKTEVRRQLHNEIHCQFAKILSDNINEIIKEEIKIVMAKPVYTDNGYGKHKEYPSFEELFKESFLDRLNNTWDMQSIIKKQVTEKVHSLYKKDYLAVASKIVEALALPEPKKVKPKK